jgi:hypothetical protein
MIQDVIQYLDDEDEEGIIVFMDQQKTCDVLVQNLCIVSEHRYFSYNRFPVGNLMSLI